MRKVVDGSGPKVRVLVLCMEVTLIPPADIASTAGSLGDLISSSTTQTGEQTDRQTYTDKNYYTKILTDKPTVTATGGRLVNSCKKA